MSMNNLTVDGEFRYIIQWFNEWSELQRDDFVPILVDYLTRETSGVYVNGLVSGLANAEVMDKPMSLFQCRIVFKMELSAYAKALDALSKCRYMTKIEKIDKDPYLMVHAKELPKNVKFSSIFNYLVKTKSPYTGNEFNNSQSISKAQDLFEAGWLRDIGGTRLPLVYVVLGKVHHSQRLNEKPLQAWVLVNLDGEIECAHCQCKAGLFETCSHVGIVLFALESVYRGCISNPIKLFKEWTPKWPEEMKNRLKEKIIEMDSKVAEKIIHELKSESGGVEVTTNGITTSDESAELVNGNNEHVEELHDEPEVVEFVSPPIVANEEVPPVA